jgi:hypothetical protein
MCCTHYAKDHREVSISRHPTSQLTNVKDGTETRTMQEPAVSPLAGLTSTLILDCSIPCLLKFLSVPILRVESNEKALRHLLKPKILPEVTLTDGTTTASLYQTVV